MPSQSLIRWAGERSVTLDEIETAHASVGGNRPGRRYATQQLNRAYALLLSSQFQGFCRDLHSECIDHVIAVTAPGLQAIMRMQFLHARNVDRGNPNPSNIQKDFARFGIDFWRAIHAGGNANKQRQAYLEELNTWRNAIAHQDFDPSKLGGTVILRLEVVRRWRAATNSLASAFDGVMRAQLQSLLGRFPW